MLNDIVADIAVDTPGDQGPQPSHRDACAGQGGCGNSFGKLEGKFFDFSRGKRSRAGPSARSCSIGLNSHLARQLRSNDGIERTGVEFENERSFSVNPHRQIDPVSN